jgi:hypothetical protein
MRGGKLPRTMSRRGDVLRKLLQRARWLFALAIALAWLRSYWRHDYVELRYIHPLPSREISELSFASGKGGFLIEFDSSWWNPENEQIRYQYPRPWSWTALSDVPDYEWNYFCRFGFEENSFGKRGRQGYGRSVVAPYPALLAVILLVPAVRGIRRYVRHRRSQRKGLCPSCGYDLRASPAQCPECGTPTAVT